MTGTHLFPPSNLPLSQAVVKEEEWLITCNTGRSIFLARSRPVCEAAFVGIMSKDYGNPCKKVDCSPLLASVSFRSTIGHHYGHQHRIQSFLASHTKILIGFSLRLFALDLTWLIGVEEINHSKDRCIYPRNGNGKRRRRSVIDAWTLSQWLSYFNIDLVKTEVDKMPTFRYCLGWDMIKLLCFVLKIFFSQVQKNERSFSMVKPALIAGAQAKLSIEIAAFLRMTSWRLQQMNLDDVYEGKHVKS